MTEFRRVCAKDNLTYMDVFLPVIERLVGADNPQLHFKTIGTQLVLSKNLPKAAAGDLNPRTIKRVCPRCGGEGCQFCANDGWVAEDPAP